VIEIKSKVLGIAVVFLAIAILATPVMAAPTNKVPARAAITVLGFEMDPTTDVRVTDDGIEHISYLMMYGTIELYEGDNPTPIIVDWVDICEGLYNPKCDKSVWRFDEVWSIEGSPAFVGTDHVNTVGPLTEVESMKSHMILHGVGDYDGQILNLWFVTGEGLVGTWLKS